jgi:hypothetical protein
MIHSIKEILAIDPYKLTLRFDSNEIRQVDLTEKLSDWESKPESKFAALKDPNIFCKVKLDPEFDSLVWENGIDLCPDVLYDLSTEFKNKRVEF